MPGETKSNGQKDSLDRFYTPTEITKQCLSLLDLTEYDCIIEPSAGAGAFSSQIPNCFAYDVQPGGAQIEQADWLKLDKNQFSSYQSVLVIGNPPFGRQNVMALRFLKESMKFANTVAFILPLSFKKVSLQNQIPLDFALSKELDLSDGWFTLGDEKISIPCVFQVWEKRKVKRKKVQLPTETSLFEFVKKAGNPSARIQRVGGNAGKASLNLEYSEQSNYFVRNRTELSDEEFCEVVNGLVFPSISYTVGPKSLSKGELVAVCEENREKFEKRD